jgi:long-chain fatty acid transport protein
MSGRVVGSAVRKLLFLGTSAVALAASLLAAQAGGFASRDQSAVGEGMAFAGEGTPGMGLSAMFWNPAAVTQAKGWGVEADVSARFPRADLTTNPALVTPALQFLDSCTPAGPPPTCDHQGNVLKDRVFPAFYGAYRVTPDWYVGLAINQPFGFKSAINDTGVLATGLGNGPGWSGQQLASSASISTVDVNPTVGWKINNTVSVGAGIQFLWLRNEFSRDLNPLPGAANIDSPINLSASDFGVGFTAGATITPTPATEIALGYRSRVKLTLTGSEFFVPNAALLASPATAPFSGATVGVAGPLTLPDQFNIGVRQRLTDTWTVLGTVEWTHWSITRNTPYFATSGPLAGNNAGMDINFNYRDGWYVAAGAEYRATATTTVRAGLGYDVSPVHGGLGWVALPDANSTSASIGLTQKLTDRLSFDVSYSYKWMANQTINVGPGNPDQTKLITLIPGVFNTWGGNISSHDQVLSLALRYNFAEATPAPLITKAK